MIKCNYFYFLIWVDNLYMIFIKNKIILFYFIIKFRFFFYFSEFYELLFFFFGNW